MDASDYRIGQVLVISTAENYINAGIRITNIVERGLVVQRLNACYLQETVESWTLRWDQLENGNWFLLPVGYQMPLL